MVRLGEISIQQALCHFVVKPTKKKRTIVKLRDHQIVVKRNSQRYILFKNKGLSCVCCGLTANKAYFEQNLSKFDATQPAHINFYLVRKGVKDLLFTKDHIIPVSKGGKDVQENYQVMCQDCNTKKGNLIEGNNMKPIVEEKIDLTVPGPVPKEPDYYVNSCDCEQCLLYRGTYEKDEDTEFPNTPEYIQ